MDGCADTHSWMMMMFSSVSWTRPMGYFTVYERSIREQNGIYRGSSSVQPSIRRSCRRTRVRRSARAHRALVRPRVRVDGSIGYIFDASGVVVVVRVRRSHRSRRTSRGWMDGWIGKTTPRCDSESEEGIDSFLFLAGREPWICERVKHHTEGSFGFGFGRTLGMDGEMDGEMDG